MDCPRDYYYDKILSACISCADICSVKAKGICSVRCPTYSMGHVPSDGWITIQRNVQDYKSDEQDEQDEHTSDNLIHEPLFWIAISMLIAAVATLSIICLCIFGWLSARRHNMYSIRPPRLLRSVERPLQKKTVEQEPPQNEMETINEICTKYNAKHKKRDPIKVYVVSGNQSPRIEADKSRIKRIKQPIIEKKHIHPIKLPRHVERRVETIVRVGSTNTVTEVLNDSNVIYIVA